MASSESVGHFQITGTGTAYNSTSGKRVLLWFTAMSSEGKHMTALMIIEIDMKESN
jgi:hypothetical protein